MSRRGNKPKATTEDVATPGREDNADKQTPLFCLAYLNKDFSLDQCDKDAQAAFAQALAKRATMTWSEIKRSGRHALGSELLPKGDLRAAMPEKFNDAIDHFHVFRYHGKLPMAGVRVGAVFHIVAIEREFGELYDHGS